MKEKGSEVNKNKYESTKGQELCRIQQENDINDVIRARRLPDSRRTLHMQQRAASGRYGRRLERV